MNTKLLGLAALCYAIAGDHSWTPPTPPVMNIDPPVTRAYQLPNRRTGVAFARRRARRLHK